MSIPLTPFLTEYDPAISSEGSLDPLGLYAIADSLAVRLVPGVRERQSRPRFLTAIAAGNVVCSDFDEDAVASDRVSMPWQVFEWYMVEGMVLTAKDSKGIMGLPGRDKAHNAIQDRVPLSAKRYLKVPNVFGFHGVYRILAKTLDVEQDRCLGEFGYRLITTWCREQGLKGFYGEEEGVGKEIRRMLTSAVRDGLKKGATDRNRGWKGWQFFNNYLNHFKCGKEERKVIADALLSEDFRRQVLECLISKEGQKVWMSSGSEKLFHEVLMGVASSSLKELVKAIMDYEAFARVLQSIFDECLLFLSNKNTRVSLSDLARVEHVSTSFGRIKSLFKRSEESLVSVGESGRLVTSFGSLVEANNVTEWVRALIDHHIRVQSDKPPNGKRPWYEQFDDGSVFIRPMYRRDKGGMWDDSYVHYYRTIPLWSFATDLGLLK